MRIRRLGTIAPKKAMLLALLIVQLGGCIGVAARNADVSDPQLGINGRDGISLQHKDGSPLPPGAWVSKYGPVPRGGLRYIQMGAWEPTIGADPDGTLFVHATSLNPGAPRVARSTDQGKTWTALTPSVQGVSYVSAPFDPLLHVDADTGRVFTFDLLLHNCNSLAYSDDAGDSWTIQPISCGDLTFHDHQTLWTSKPRTISPVMYPNVVHYCVNRVTDAACARSLNGGLTWTPLRPLVWAGVEPSAPRGDEICMGLSGHGHAAADGTIYLPGARCGIPSVAISRDDGLTWTNVQIADAPRTPPGILTLGLHEFVPVRDHEIGFGTDDAGNAYALWIGEHDLLPYLAVSHDGGLTWDDPFVVSPAGIGAVAFPTLAASEDGHVVAAYYGTSADKEYLDMTKDDRWNGYLTVIMDAAKPEPSLATVRINAEEDPLARGICGGTRCPGDAFGVGDFMDVTIDPDGRPWAVFVDICHTLCREDGAKDGHEAVVGTLLSGPRLRGDSPLPRLPPVSDPYATPPAGSETFYQNGTLVGFVGHEQGPAVPLRLGPTLRVQDKATAILYEMRWNEPNANLFVDQVSARGFIVYTAKGYSIVPSLDLGFRVIGTEPAMLRPLYSETAIRGTLALRTEYQLAVTVFYEDDPTGFTAFRDAYSGDDPTSTTAEFLRR